MKKKCNMNPPKLSNITVTNSNDNEMDEISKNFKK
jgi:hypothetical protein